MTVHDAPELTAVYRRVPDARVRPLPEWAGALVYTPSSPSLCYLNTTTWAVFELCDGVTRGELEDAFIEFIGDDVAAGEARERLEESLAMLAEKRLVTTS
jgi:hypothetical protein